jgi:4-amino-4-deoxy-L-arabinose transferase-like glycosyltransferase
MTDEKNESTHDEDREGVGGDDAHEQPVSGGDGADGEAERVAPSATDEPVPVPPAPPRDADQRRPVHWLRGGIPMLVGGLVLFCICAADTQFRWSVPVGFLATLVSVWGLLDLLGTFDAPDDRVASRVTIRAIAPAIGALFGSLFLTLVLITVAVAGYTSWKVNAVLIPAAFLSLVVSVYKVGERLGAWVKDEAGLPRAMHQRHGFWLVVAATVLYLPMLGSYSLSDPWETHYGEVAREILSRDDWISTWWAQDGWFWSKPVLNFWTEALSMSLFGVGYKPDQMFAAVALGREPWPEWAVRMPVFILTVVALYLLYKGVANVFGRRAGLLGALVLATMPHWYLIGHQTMTDMPFVSSMTAAMGLLLLALHTDPEREVKVYEIDLGVARFRLSAYHLVIGAILMAVLPQVLYLLSRNIELQIAKTPFGFRIHEDVFFSGSAGNCGGGGVGPLPGNQACTQTFPVPSNRATQPWMEAMAWTLTTGLLLWDNRKERRLASLYALAAWLFAAISTMGKGPAGFLLPMLCAGAYIFASGRWRKLLDIKIQSGLLIIASVALPWYVAMYMRHGQPFTDRLLFHDMWKRAIVHVHDTNVGDDVSFRYYVWQLGYALFPWTGLVPVGLVWWLRRRQDALGSGRGDVSVFLAMWFVFAFALFTAMLTKFHHYIFPAVPPAAMLTGIVLDRLIGDRKLARSGGLLPYLVLVGGGAALTVYGFFRLFPGTLAGFKPEGAAPRPGMPWLGIPIIIAGALIVGAGVRMYGATSNDPEGGERSRDQRDEFEDVLLGASGVAAAIVLGLIGYDLASRPPNDTPGQAILMQLFTYNYKRAWPDTLEFSGMLAAFSLVAVGLMVLLVLRRYRSHLVAMTMAVGIAWAAWGVNIYLVKASPHWGQREIILAYYRHRAGPEEPIVAYQMNWKGENFYTGNRIPAFVSSGANFKTWIDEQRKAGVKTMYFVTEHGRSKGLQNELGKAAASFETVTDRVLNNKFAIFRVRIAPPGQDATAPPPSDDNPGAADTPLGL